MAHVLVYLQRTSLGLHPASAAALCLARDFADARGATVTALCAGDGKTLDEGITTAAGRFGADVLMFCGPEGLEEMVDRLHPVHVLAPWTAEGLAAVQGLPSGPVVPRWIDRAPPRLEADAVTGVVAGTAPWHVFDQPLDPEFLGAVDTVPMPAWVSQTAALDREVPVFAMVGPGPLRFIAPHGVPDRVEALLTHHRMEAATVEDLERDAMGTFVWLGDGRAVLPDALTHRTPTARLVLLAGEGARVDPSWASADLVVAGTWTDALGRLHEPLWRTAIV
jgi:hypothetical protein